MRDFLTSAQEAQIKAAIGEAERMTSGEIRLYIESKCKGEVLDRAAFIFEELAIHKTKDRSGVLFYLAYRDRKFAILGDAGINAKTGAHFWDEIKLVVEKKFKEQDFCGGLEQGITMAGAALSKHFPYEEGDKNELSDEIAYGK